MMQSDVFSQYISKTQSKSHQKDKVNRLKKTKHPFVKTEKRVSLPETKQQFYGIFKSNC